MTIVNDGPAYAAPLRAVDSLSRREHDGELHLQVEKEIRLADPYQADHFPDRTVYPGVFIVETIRQAVIAALGERDGLLPDLSAVHSLRFLGGMHPGERLCVEVTIRPADTHGAHLVDALCRRDNSGTVARLQLEFEYQAGPDA